MNIRKATDYSTMYTELDELMGQSLPQMELYREIGRLICFKPEKGAAIMALEYAGFTIVRNYLAGGVTPPFSKSSGNKTQYVNEKAVNYFDHF